MDPKKEFSLSFPGMLIFIGKAGLGPGHPICFLEIGLNGAISFSGGSRFPHPTASLFEEFWGVSPFLSEKRKKDMKKMKEILWALIIAVACCWMIEKAVESTREPMDPPEIKLRVETGALYFKEFR